MLPIKCHFWKESTTKQKFCLKVEQKFVEQNCRTKNCDHCRKPINVGNAKSALHESSINCKKSTFLFISGFLDCAKQSIETGFTTDMLV